MPWAKRATKRIPSISSPSSTYEINDYSQGLNNYVSNDKFPFKNGQANMWRLAQDARITTLGEYDTRKGFDFHSEAAGVTLDQSITAVTGTADKQFNTVNRLAQKFVPVTSGRLAKIDLNLKNSMNATGVVLAAIYTNISNAPGALLAISSVAGSDITSSYVYKTFHFVSAPQVAAGATYWIVTWVQDFGSNSYSWSSTSSASTALASTNNGSTWNTTSYALNFKQYYAVIGGSKGLCRATKSDGTKYTLFVNGTTLYAVDNVSGALTTIKSGLNSSATLYRFWVVNDVVYYVNGYDGYRKWNFTTESQINTTNYVDLTVHKGIMFLQRADDQTRLDFSNFADYETFTSTDFINVPAPKTGDPIASMNSLNGYLLLRTQNRCFIFSGEDNATFRLDEAPDQKGTFGPNTSCVDKTYTYFLSDDGVYKSNGTQPTLMSENIYETIKSLTNKQASVIAVSKGRLYLWFASPGSSVNDSCYVWNLNYSGGADTIESFDTNAYVSHAVSSYRDNDNLIVASSVTGQVFWQELDSNDYTNAGGFINFELRTHYIIGPSAAVLKEIRYWEPRFAAQGANYTIDCDYAYDRRDNWQTYNSPSVQGVGAVWGSPSTVWGNFSWGSTAEMQSQLYVPGEYRRIALRYKHYATRQPNKFLGHTFVMQSRRLR